ncbi:MAG: DNA mismatch repair endonuclease MutL [Clostridiales bacterium]|nr:DNA mismatch repair endonuclease MutL [Clostridiales bacterium]
MSRINILPASVYNRIAAGEVVDRPYSVVKELVENAIDAGADEIQIYIENGGKQLIRVVDNGCGIAYDDLHSAFLPHATSKIEKANDLENIVTLGFRGEAVASIASVSKMTITSKVADGKCFSLTSEGGEIGKILPCSGENGTDVRVETLFYNTPVRLGFLKSDKGEETDITQFVSKFILNRPEIAFAYYVNGKKVLQSFGGGKEEALVGIYGSSILQNVYQINADKHGIKVSGFIGNQNFSKPNKTYQCVFLNGRYIVNQTIATAVMKAYSSYLMKRQYPFYVLYIDVPSEIVDVNVHPNKADVRFADNQIIFGIIYKIISSVLDGQASALDYMVQTPIENSIEKEEVFEEKPVEATKDPLKNSISRFTSRFFTPDDKKSDSRLSNSVFSEVENSEEAKVPTMSYEEAKKEIEEHSPYFAKIKELKSSALPFDLEEDSKIKITKNKNIAPFTGKTVSMDELISKKPKKGEWGDAETLRESYPELYFEQNVLEVNNPKENKRKESEVDYFAENKKFLEELEKKKKQNRIEVSSCKYVGKLFNTYLLYERDSDVYIIDQHAAHERLIFNRLKEQMKTRTVNRQPMLLPYQLNLNSFESEFIKDNIEYIRQIGFDIEEASASSFNITAVPLDLQKIDLGVFFNDILGDISGFRSIKLEDLLKDKLATAACKAAIKGGMDLTQEEIDALFKLIDGDMGLKCPHGRPVVTKLTKTELEKMFKRIV